MWAGIAQSIASPNGKKPLRGNTNVLCLGAGTLFLFQLPWTSQLQVLWPLDSRPCTCISPHPQFKGFWPWTESYTISLPGLAFRLGLNHTGFLGLHLAGTLPLCFSASIIIWAIFPKWILSHLVCLDRYRDRPTEFLSWEYQLICWWYIGYKFLDDFSSH